MKKNFENISKKYCFSDFTEKNYRRLLKLAQKRFEFKSFHTKSKNPHIILRHDVDISIHRSLKLAKIEADLDIQSTYFLRLHSEYYNIFEKEIFEKIKEIIKLKHEIGLHFDVDFYSPIKSEKNLVSYLLKDKKILEYLLSRKIKVFSYHNPDIDEILKYDNNHLAGMVNVYGKNFKKKYTYCSDSNGFWRFNSLKDTILDKSINQIHVLLHPEWWQANSLSPKQRIVRCIEGKAKNNKSLYKKTLKKMSRKNIG
jgi:hypothetical protein